MSESLGRVKRSLKSFVKDKKKIFEGNGESHIFRRGQVGTTA